jgi:hypothetical protein
MSYYYSGYNPTGQQYQRRDVTRYGHSQQPSDYSSPALNDYGTLMPNIAANQSSNSNLRVVTEGKAIHPLEDRQTRSVVSNENAAPATQTVFKNNVEILQTLKDHQEILWTASGKPKSGKSGSPGRMQLMNLDGINAIMKSQAGEYPQRLKDAVIALNANSALKTRLLGEDGIASIGDNGIHGAAFKRSDLDNLLDEKNRGIVNALGK